MNWESGGRIDVWVSAKIAKALSILKSQEEKTKTIEEAQKIRAAQDMYSDVNEQAVDTLRKAGKARNELDSEQGVKLEYALKLLKAIGWTGEQINAALENVLQKTLEIGEDIRTLQRLEDSGKFKITVKLFDLANPL